MKPLPPPLVRFLELYRAGEYWESHEALEDAWRGSRSELYHGLILLASAFVHAGRGNAHGVRAQLEKAERALGPFRPAYLGLDIEAILERAAECRRIAEAEPAGWADRVRAPELRPDPSLVRGDEPELQS